MGRLEPHTHNLILIFHAGIEIAENTAQNPCDDCKGAQCGSGWRRYHCESASDRSEASHCCANLAHHAGAIHLVNFVEFQSLHAITKIIKKI
jgi:hypothetical protein